MTSNLRAPAAQGQCRRLVQRCGSCGKRLSISSEARDPCRPHELQVLKNPVVAYAWQRPRRHALIRLLATRVSGLLPVDNFPQFSSPHFCVQIFCTLFFAQQRNFVFAEGNSRAFRQAAVTNRGLRASIQYRHEITKRDKKGAAGDCAAESTCFWCGPFMAGYVTAAVADVSHRPCTCRAAEQGFARTEAGSGGPSGRRQSFF